MQLVSFYTLSRKSIESELLRDREVYLCPGLEAFVFIWESRGAHMQPDARDARAESRGQGDD